MRLALAFVVSVALMSGMGFAASYFRQDFNAPMRDQIWDLIEAVTYKEVITDNGDWLVEKTIPEALSAMEGRVTVTGYYVPVEAQAYVSYFLLVPDPADCPFCGQNGYGANLEVQMARPMPDMPEATRVTIRGTLELDRSAETYRVVYLTEGRLTR